MFTMFMTKAKISPTTINKRSAEHTNNFKSEKYKLTLNEIEKKSLENQRFRTEFNFERVKLSKKPWQTRQVQQKNLLQKKEKIMERAQC